MTPRFETYVSSPTEIADQRFVVVAYNEGRGKFHVRQNRNVGSEALSYVVT